MILYPAFILTIFAPGFFFPEMASWDRPVSPSVSSAPEREKRDTDVEGEYKTVTPDEGVLTRDGEDHATTDAGTTTVQ